MYTKGQEALLQAFYADIPAECQPAYRGIVEQLGALGYLPRKEKANISFKHTQHNKQIAKMGVRTGKHPAPFFSLRFSGCQAYSRRFADIVQEAIRKYPHKVAQCLEGKCGYCAGAPESHVYACTLPDGERKAHCGAYALPIPELAAQDVGEIRQLLQQEHAYLMAHEVGRA